MNTNYIYILKCVENRYYIGKTKDPYARIDAHLNGKGCYFTKKYNVLSLEKLIPNCEDEDKYVLEYMNKYGIENVRGGSFSSIELEPMDKLVITKMLRTMNNECFQCGSKSHWVKSCNHINTKNIISNLLIGIIDYIIK